MTEEQLLKASKTAEKVASKKINLLFSYENIDNNYQRMRFLELYIEQFHSYIFEDLREL